MTALTVFGWLVAMHLVCDYPLQGDFLARAKNHRDPIPGVPAWLALWSHAGIHAGGVALVLALTLDRQPQGVLFLAIMELVVHQAIDWGKCEGRFGLVWDQALHVACKAAWAAAAVRGIL